MPCSCKKTTSSIAYRDPAQPTQTKVYTSSFIPQEPQKVPVEVQKEQYDFSSQTKPHEFCLNCIQKHLSLAYLFFQQNSIQYNLMGIGELLCARQHMISTKPYMADQLYRIALNALREKNFKETQKIIADLMQLFLQDKFPDGQIEDIPSISILQGQLFILLTAYSQLFIELTYLSINKSWVTGEMASFVWRKFGETKDIEEYNKYRQVWKLIQSMGQYDDTYFKAQDGLQSLINIAYKNYKKELSDSSSKGVEKRAP